jgi:hypothetical protein
MMLDHSHTKVILIGNSSYPNWPDGNIKNIEVNLDMMKKVLCDANLVGIRNPENIFELKDKSKLDIQLTVSEVTANCSNSDNLLIYYAGHGLLDIEDLKKLYLATSDTRITSKKFTCIASDELKEPLIKCKAKNKIMILDCCFAAKAAGLQSDAVSLSGNYWGDTEGVYFMMSSDIDEPSRYDPKDSTIPTFFTQKLIQTITEGAELNREIWTLDEVFDVMKQKWDKAIAPEPINLTYREVGRMPFCYNRYKIAVGVANQSMSEKAWAEIEKNPSEDNITQFILTYPELKNRALDLWSKMQKDWELLNQALAQDSFDALRTFLLESNPVPPVLKIALDKMKVLSAETRDILQNPGRRSRDTSRNKRGGATGTIDPMKP